MGDGRPPPPKHGPNLDLSLTVAPRSGLGPTYQLESGRVLQASPSGEEAALC